MPGGTVDPALLPLSNRQSCVLASSIPDLQLGKVRTCNILRARGWGGGYLLRLFALPVPAVQGCPPHSPKPALTGPRNPRPQFPAAETGACALCRALRGVHREGHHTLAVGGPGPHSRGGSDGDHPGALALCPPGHAEEALGDPIPGTGAVQGAGLVPREWGQGTTEPLLTPSIPTLMADSKLFPLGPCSSYF